MGSLKDRIMEELKSSMKSRDQVAVDTLRMLTAAFKQVEVDERVNLDDARCLALLEKQIKQRRESLAAYEGAGRIDLADKERTELSVLQKFMPTPLSPEEISQLIATAIAETGAQTVRDMGRVMNVLRPLVSGRADTGEVSALVKSMLPN